MTTEERLAIESALRSINVMAGSLEMLATRLKALELAVVSMHGRLRLYEAGEVEVQRLPEVH